MPGTLRPAALTPQVTEAFLAARRERVMCCGSPRRGWRCCWVTCGGWARRRSHRRLRPRLRAVLLERYRRYLVTERGLAATTARGYADMVRPFLAGREDSGGLGPERAERRPRSRRSCWPRVRACPRARRS